MYDFESMDPRFIAYVNMFICANRLQTIMDSGLEDITAKQWLALMMIDAFPEPPTLKQMSEISGVTHQSMRQIVDRLVDKGILQPTDNEPVMVDIVEEEPAVHMKDGTITFNFDKALKEEAEIKEQPIKKTRTRKKKEDGTN